MASLTSLRGIHAHIRNGANCVCFGPVAENEWKSLRKNDWSKFEAIHAAIDHVAVLGRWFWEQAAKLGGHSEGGPVLDQQH